MRGAERVCGFGFAGPYACIQGSCGDGTCEPAEARPCVCPADCASAVWETPQRDASNASDTGDAGVPVVRDF
jgi:hypothetical protein